MYVMIASLSVPNLVRASANSIADASCAAAVPILKAGAPSGLAAVAMLPALPFTSSTVSLYSDAWIFRYGSTIDDGIGEPPAGVFDVAGAGMQAAANINNTRQGPAFRLVRMAFVI